MYTLWQDVSTSDKEVGGDWVVIRQYKSYLEGLWAQHLYTVSDTIPRYGKFMLRADEEGQPDPDFYKSLMETVRYAPLKPKFRNDYEIEVYAKGIEAGLFKAINTVQYLAANTSDKTYSELCDSVAEEIIDASPYVSHVWKTISSYNVENHKLRRENEELRQRIAELEKGSQ